MSLRVGVLASGSGTNLQALLDSVHRETAVEIVAVGSDKPGARALRRARAAGVEERAFPVAEYEDRAARDDAIADWLVSRRVDLVVLAGYMQLLSPSFLRAFPQAVINVHPALLPSFPGIQSVERAVDHGVKVTGVTVHFVDDGVDTGPIILQRAFDVPQGASVEVVRGLLQPIEHELLPRAVRLFATGALSFDPGNPRRVVIS
jgi:phosphoribosylglycinamide formyltransferase 1